MQKYNQDRSFTDYVHINLRIPLIYDTLNWKIKDYDERGDENREWYLGGEITKVEYEKGIKIDPNFAIIYNNLGLLFTENKFDEKKGEDFYKKSISLNQKIPELHLCSLPSNILRNFWTAQCQYIQNFFF